MKERLRKTILQQRKALGAKAYRQLSDNIIKRLEDQGLLEGMNSVHLYYPINNEVDTRPLLQRLIQKSVPVVMPRTDFANKRIDNYLITHLDQLEQTRFGLHEPKTDCPSHQQACDLILVPGVAFDTRLNRIGYGGGFYDRFLQHSPGRRVALAFEFQLREQLPVEEHDIRMDCIVTETGIYE